MISIILSSCYLELEVSQPQNSRYDGEDGIHLLCRNLNDGEGEAKTVEPGGIIHTVQLGAAGLVQVEVVGGRSHMELLS